MVKGRTAPELYSATERNLHEFAVNVSLRQHFCFTFLLLSAAVMILPHMRTAGVMGSLTGACVRSGVRSHFLYTCISWQQRSAL